MLRLLPVLLFILGGALTVSAQNAEFSGNINDPHQARVPGAQIRLVNQATGTVYKVTSNKEGFYLVPFVSPGTYKVFVQKQGFNTAISEPLTVTTGQEKVFDVGLRIGGNQEEVIVSESSQLLNTTDASVSTIIDQQFVENQPLNGRSRRI
jgi:hypothetical protein